MSTLLGVVSSARAETIVLEPVADTTLYAENGDGSNGAGDHLFAGQSNSSLVRRALIRFDLSVIPGGSTVTDATLSLYMSRARVADPRDITLHRVTTSWGEAGSHASAEEGAAAMAMEGDATWTYSSYNTESWVTPGGDYVASPSATASVGAVMMRYEWSTPQMVSEAQAWLDMSYANDGWILIGEESTLGGAKRFDSRTIGDATRRPMLTIEFTPPALPSGACCLDSGMCLVSIEAVCTGSYSGDGSSCDPNPCPEPAGACCMPDSSCSVETVSSCAGNYLGHATTCDDDPCPLVLTPYVDPLPLPGVAQPVSGNSGGEADYDIYVRQVQQQLHRDLPPSTVWVYDDGNGGSFPGPTIEARRNEMVRVTWLNDLRDIDDEPLMSHFLPVDPCPHGAARGETRVVTHLHGGHVSTEADGQPEETLMPGQSVTYEYPNWQDASTIWYHDHALGNTRINVYAGLAALYIIRDDVEEALGLPAGEYEVPLVIQDRTFDPDGTLQYPATWQEHFFGEVNLVNGKVTPYFEVAQGKYRFRILNGANSRTYTLRFSDGRPFTVIGVDGGLLEAPSAVTEITLGGAERADVIVDFSDLDAGDEVLLENSAPAPFPGVAGVRVLPEVMQFRVTAEVGHTADIPSSLRSLEVLDADDATATRDFVLRRDGTSECGGQGWLINGLRWDDITERPVLGETEVWRFINRSGISHPMHVHLEFFQMLDRQHFELQSGFPVPVGEPVGPRPWEQGWKDTVMVGPSEIVRVAVRFEDFVGRFPYHCHILEHEDHEMMRQFETTTECGDGARGIPDEECDDGNTEDGDGCSATCSIEVPIVDAGADSGTDSGMDDLDAGVDASIVDASTPDSSGADGAASEDASMETDPDEGCGCRAGRSGAPDLVLHLAMLMLLLRRRRPEAR